MMGYVPRTHGYTVIVYIMECKMAKQMKASSFVSVTDGLEPHPPLSFQKILGRTLRTRKRVNQCKKHLHCPTVCTQPLYIAPTCTRLLKSPSLDPWYIDGKCEVNDSAQSKYNGTTVYQIHVWLSKCFTTVWQKLTNYTQDYFSWYLKASRKNT